MTAMKVLLADDHAIFRECLRSVLASENDSQVAGEAANGDELLELIQNIEADVVILDLEMPVKSGFVVLDEIKQKHPDLPVLILSSYAEEQYATRAIKSGASGYLRKTLMVDEFILALRKVASGERYLPVNYRDNLPLMPSSADPLDPLDPLKYLSEREFDVFNQIVAGSSINEIAAEMNLSPKTVSTYRSRIYEKLSVTSHAELFSYARSQELL